MSLKLNQCSAMQGWVWLIQALQLFKSKPGEVFFLGNTYLFVMLIPTLFIPYVGSLFIGILSPALTAGVMLATHNSLRGQKTKPQSLFIPLLGNNIACKKNLLKLGMIYALSFLMIRLLNLVILGQSPPIPEDFNISEIQTHPELQQHILFSFLLVTVCTIPTMLAFWFAPALVLWHNMSAAKAMFASCVAMWRNRYAFIVYSLGWFVLVLTAVVTSVLIVSVLGIPATFVSAIHLLLGILIMAISLQTFYPTYISIFITDNSN